MNQTSNVAAEIELRNVDIIFGEQQQDAVNLLDKCGTREEILEQTGAVIGVCGASISVDKGEICVLMGLSGSGKSTLMRAVNGLNPITRGEVILNHEGSTIDIAKVSSAKLREIRKNRVSMVFQQFALLPWRTVAQNVGFGLELKGLSKTERPAIIDEKLEMVGLLQWRDKYAHELSGGMQQRVGLARAFATDADILLMDEPFSALDPLIRSRLQDELLELQETLHKTVLFVSHDLDEALKLGTQIAIMESGRIVQRGSAEEIVLNPVNQYVTDFVAHMNPVGVLKAKSIMSSIDLLPNENGRCQTSDSGIEIVLSDNGAIKEARRGERVITVAEWKEGAELLDGHLYQTLVETSMKDVIEIRHVSGYPVILADDDGAVVGVIHDHEIYCAILHRRQMNQPNQSTST